MSDKVDIHGLPVRRMAEAQEALILAKKLLPVQCQEFTSNLYSESTVLSGEIRYRSLQNKIFRNAAVSNGKVKNSVFFSCIIKDSSVEDFSLENCTFVKTILDSGTKNNYERKLQGCQFQNCTINATQVLGSRITGGQVINASIWSSVIINTETNNAQLLACQIEEGKHTQSKLIYCSWHNASSSLHLKNHVFEKPASASLRRLPVEVRIIIFRHLLEATRTFKHSTPALLQALRVGDRNIYLEALDTYYRINTPRLVNGSKTNNGRRAPFDCEKAIPLLKPCPLLKKIILNVSESGHVYLDDYLSKSLGALAISWTKELGSASELKVLIGHRGDELLVAYARVKVISAGLGIEPECKYHGKYVNQHGADGLLLQYVWKARGGEVLVWKGVEQGDLYLGPQSEWYQVLLALQALSYP